MSSSEYAKTKKNIVIIPHTHWDREWYKSFQEFRFKLVQLIDKLIEINKEQDYFFMLDGQTIVLEDYFEIKPEKKEILLNLIKSGKIDVGPWYLLPDEWLVSGESLIRNLEHSYDLAESFDIPLMKVGYLPDQFGHTRAIPQILRDLTKIDTAVIWRGVGKEINSVPFAWKSHKMMDNPLLGVYMPYGYGNAAHLPETLEEFEKTLKEKIDELEEFSPFKHYLLMNGTDHQFPQPKIAQLIAQIKDESFEIRLDSLATYVRELKNRLEQKNFQLNEYVGEFRSPERAPLLQDTYSARMWIKIWNQKVEDKLVHLVEPLSTYMRLYFGKRYPESYLNLAWKWFLRNHPHDSICGCSVDQTHEEMKTRYSWSESIADSILFNITEELKENLSNSKNNTLSVFNPTNNPNPSYLEFHLPSRYEIKGLKDKEGNYYDIQPLHSSSEIIFDERMRPAMLRAGIRMLSGRKINEFFVNDITIFDDETTDTCEIKIILDSKPVGELEISSLKEQIKTILDKKTYKYYHVVATTENKQTYCTVAPLTPWAFTNFELVETISQRNTDKQSFLKIKKKSVENEYYQLKFNRDGTFSVYDKKTNTQYSKLHQFEDWGDRGDEYTFGRIGPIRNRTKKVKRKIVSHGPIMGEIKQSLTFKTFKELNEKRDKRKGKANIKVTSFFRFYRDSPRIDIKTQLTNTAKDHRLRICFNLPYESETTLTSTHFGFIERMGKPLEAKESVEQPSGIQPQKRYVRVNNAQGNQAITLMNKGLPEVELVDKNKLALTLLRCVGWLSRSDFPERPIHAGPFLPTPGAQELSKEYTFRYSFMIHEKEHPIYKSAREAESATLSSYSLSSKQQNTLLNQAIIEFDNPWIQISSIRKKKNTILVSLYNLNNNEENLVANIYPELSKCSTSTIDGSELEVFEIHDNTVKMCFNPLEIKILKLEKN